jgi:hypothetical protein
MHVHQRRPGQACQAGYGPRRHPSYGRCKPHGLAQGCAAPKRPGRRTSRSSNGRDLAIYVHYDREEDMPKKIKSEKDPHAVSLGRKGGQATRDRRTPEERSEAARAAVNARWSKKPPKG